MSQCTFTNDNNVVISLFDHPFTKDFSGRDNHEVLFRKIHTYLINNGYISNNIIDLGAWIGDNTIPWSKTIGETNTVYAIDPSPNNCDFIRQMCELNNISNVKIIQTAVSDKNETLSTRDSIDHCSFLNEGTVKMEAVSLDHLYNSGVISKIGYIHLDVEGMEHKVIMGATKLIEECTPIIAFEQHLKTDNFIDLIDYMGSKNYFVFMIDEILPGCLPDCRNFIAFPKSDFNYSILNEISTHFGHNVFIF